MITIAFLQNFYSEQLKSDNSIGYKIFITVFTLPFVFVWIIVDLMFLPFTLSGLIKDGFELLVKADKDK